MFLELFHKFKKSFTICKNQNIFHGIVKKKNMGNRFWVELRLLDQEKITRLDPNVVFVFIVSIKLIKTKFISKTLKQNSRTKRFWLFSLFILNQFCYKCKIFKIWYLNFIRKILKFAQFYGKILNCWVVVM